MATRKRLGEVLIEAGLLDEYQLNSALNHQRQFGGRLGRILIDNRYISESQLTETLSRHLQIPMIELRGRPIAPEVLVDVPLEMAEKYLIFPVATRSTPGGEQIALAMADPTSFEAVDGVQFKTGKRVAALIASETAIEAAIREHYHGERPIEVGPEKYANVQFSGHSVEIPGGAAAPTAANPAPAPEAQLPPLEPPAMLPPSLATPQPTAGFVAPSQDPPGAPPPAAATGQPIPQPSPALSGPTLPTPGSQIGPGPQLPHQPVPPAALPAQPFVPPQVTQPSPAEPGTQQPQPPEPAPSLVTGTAPRPFPPPQAAPAGQGESPDQQDEWFLSPAAGADPQSALGPDPARQMRLQATVPTEELFGSPNSFLGRDGDSAVLGQEDIRFGPVSGSAPSPSAPAPETEPASTAPESVPAPPASPFAQPFTPPAQVPPDEPLNVPATSDVPATQTPTPTAPAPTAPAPAAPAPAALAPTALAAQPEPLVPVGPTPPAAAHIEPEPLEAESLEPEPLEPEPLEPEPLEPESLEPESLEPESLEPEPLEPEPLEPEPLEPEPLEPESLEPEPLEPVPLEPLLAASPGPDALPADEGVEDLEPLAEQEPLDLGTEGIALDDNDEPLELASAADMVEQHAATTAPLEGVALPAAEHEPIELASAADMVPTAEGHARAGLDASTSDDDDGILELTTAADMVEATDPGAQRDALETTVSGEGPPIELTSAADMLTSQTAEASSLDVIEVDLDDMDGPELELSTPAEMAADATLDTSDEGIALDIDVLESPVAVELSTPAEIAAEGHATDGTADTQASSDEDGATGDDDQGASDGNVRPLPPPPAPAPVEAQEHSDDEPHPFMIPVPREPLEGPPSTSFPDTPEKPSRAHTPLSSAGSPSGATTVRTEGKLAPAPPKAEPEERPSSLETAEAQQSSLPSAPLPAVARFEEATLDDVLDDVLGDAEPFPLGPMDDVETSAPSAPAAVDIAETGAPPPRQPTMLERIEAAEASMSLPPPTPAPVPEPAPVAEPPVQPAVAEPAVVEPAVVEPAVVEPAVVEPPVVEPPVVEPPVVEPPVAAPPLDASRIADLERLTPVTTTLSGAAGVDAYEVLRSTTGETEVMRLALGTDAFSHAAIVDAPWRLGGRKPPPGRADNHHLPTAPVGLRSTDFARVDDVVVLFGPGPDPASGNGQSKDTPFDSLPPNRPLSEAWRDAAEQQLVSKADGDLEVPAHRRMFEQTPKGPDAPTPEPIHRYEPAAPADDKVPGVAPWVLQPTKNGTSEKAPALALVAPAPLGDGHGDVDDLKAEDDRAFQDDAVLTPAPDPLPPPEPAVRIPGAASHPSDDGGGFAAPSATAITQMTPEQLRALAERLVERGAISQEDMEVARSRSMEGAPEDADSGDDDDGGSSA